MYSHTKYNKYRRRKKYELFFQFILKNRQTVLVLKGLSHKIWGGCRMIALERASGRFFKVSFSSTIFLLQLCYGSIVLRLPQVIK